MGTVLLRSPNLEQLDAVRYDLDGDGTTDPDSDAAAYAAAYSTDASETVCNNCNGYELAESLDFQGSGSYASGQVDADWTTGDGWLPIGHTHALVFGAIFEGNDHTISNLYINRTDQDYYRVGLFGFAGAPSVIRNVGIIDMDLTGRAGGGVVSSNKGEIRNSYTTGRISSTGSSVGGLVGINAVTDDGDVALITNSYSTAEVSGISHVGGLVANNSSEGRIVASYATGDVTGTRLAGGLVGYNIGAIRDSFATGNVTGSVTESAREYAVGGLVGNSWGSIVATYATGNVEGNQYVGGLVGWSAARYGDTRVIASYSTGNVSGQSGVGGLVGYLSSQEGGVSKVVASYSTGGVSGSTNTGGLVGSNFGTPVSDSYWNTQTSGQTAGLGNGASTGIEGKTTAELQQPTGYTGIYGNWNIDLDNADGDDNTATGPDDLWDFGTVSQYPSLKVDFNGDGTPSWEEFGDQHSDSGSAPAADSASDREALVALYNATGGENWLNSENWLSDMPLGEWHGVTTNSSGRVTGLDLYNNQLSGGIPPELGSLTNLTGLFLFNNQLSGGIPAELGSLTNLTRLWLVDNQLSGGIPAELGSLTNLTGLDLYNNQLSGGIPAELGSLSNLVGLRLSGNQLSGGIPAELGSLSNLEELRLGGNQLSGEIPAELGQPFQPGTAVARRQPAERGDTGGTGQPLQPGGVVAQRQPAERGDTGGTGQPLQPGGVAARRQPAERGDTGGTGQPFQPGGVVALQQPVERGDTGGTGPPFQPGGVVARQQPAERGDTGGTGQPDQPGTAVGSAATS